MKMKVYRIRLLIAVFLLIFGIAFAQTENVDLSMIYKIKQEAFCKFKD